MLLDRALVRLLPAVPKLVVRRISERYIAGEELADAVRVVRRLNGEGKLATVDVVLLFGRFSHPRDCLAKVS